MYASARMHTSRPTYNTFHQIPSHYLTSSITGWKSSFGLSSNRHESNMESPGTVLHARCQPRLALKSQLWILQTRDWAWLGTEISRAWHCGHLKLSSMSSAVCSDPIQCMQELTLGTLGKAKSPSIAFQGHSYPHRTKGCTRTHLVVVRAFQALSTSPHKLADLFFLHLAMKWWCQLCVARILFQDKSSWMTRTESLW